MTRRLIRFLSLVRFLLLAFGTLPCVTSLCHAQIFSSQVSKLNGFTPNACARFEYMDCNGNLKNDACEIADGSATDCNLNEIPDSCETAPVFEFSDTQYINSGANNQASIVSADFDRDGLTDLAIAESYNTGVLYNGRISLLFASAPGVYRAPTYHWTRFTEQPVLALAGADLDTDGDEDLVLSTMFDQEIWILINNGSGQFLSNYRVKRAQDDLLQGKARIVLEDVDGNGFDDIVYLNSTGTSASVQFFPNLSSFGQLRFGEAQLLSFATHPYDMIVAKLLPESGYMDVLYVDYPRRLLVHVQHVAGQWVEHQLAIVPPNPVPPGFGPMALESGDFNGDGYRDVAVQAYSSIYMAYGDGSGNLRPAVSLNRGAGWDLEAADMNRNGLIDLVVMGTGGVARVYQQYSPGNFDEYLTSWSRYNGEGLSLVDINHDWLPDLVFRRQLISNKSLEFRLNRFRFDGPSC